MKKLVKILLIILIIFILGIIYLFFSLSSLPSSIYNFLNPAGSTSKNTLISYEGFDVRSSFVDSVKLSEYNFLKKPVEIYDDIAKEYYSDTKIIKSSVKLGTILIMSTGANIYEYPDITTCIENKKGEFVYSLEICMNNCDNFLNSTYTLPNGSASSSLDIMSSLDGRVSYEGNGYSEISSYSPNDFSLTNLAYIDVYPTIYYQGSKGPTPHGCYDNNFYKKITPIKVIKLQ